MKCIRYIFILTALLISYVISASELSPKREMRGAWIATVYRLDWPNKPITSTGNKAEIKAIKEFSARMLDSLQRNNFNTVCFQVRSRSDAMYHSAYEPWSSDLVASRGMDPGWDPLEYMVNECHRRGLECHAWINPYRYESSSHAWDGKPGDYRKEHPDWIIDVVKGKQRSSILNPGNPNVRQRIVNIVCDIVRNYDIDGILFDDYFYIRDTPLSADIKLYKSYQKSGGKLSHPDWRRNNVNLMVAEVNAAIKQEKPWIRFGISPAGTAASDSKIAASYGIKPCPANDWQYNGIYSDPLAWMKAKSIDYISPQLYWPVGHPTNDFKALSEWWANASNILGCPCYPSLSISALANKSSKGEKTISSTKNFQEYSTQVELIRSAFVKDPGAIFYSGKHLYRTAPKFAAYMQSTTYRHPAILPKMPATRQETTLHKVDHLEYNHTTHTLTWDNKKNMRYSIYAIPSSQSFNESLLDNPSYLLGVAYNNSFKIPHKYHNNYYFAVCAYDRYGYESPAATIFVNKK